MDVHNHIPLFEVKENLGARVDRMAKAFYRWIREYSPPPLRVQISNFSAIGGSICIVLGVYLGVARAAAAVKFHPTNQHL